MDIGNSIKNTLTKTRTFLASTFGAMKISGLHITLLIWIVFFAGWVFIYFLVNSIANNHNNYFGGIPTSEILENPESEVASELYSADGILLGKYYRSNRTPLYYSEISPVVLDALYATEDVRFFDHSGIDMKGTAAIPYYIFKGDKRGSSTITQQLAKNLFNTRSEKTYQGSLVETFPKLRTPINKIKEWIVAVTLERTYSKTEIVSMYLNTVDFGSNSFGLKVAAKTFFGKDQKDLNVEEAAMLVGLLKAPTQFSPILNPDAALKRRNTVLDQMEKYHKISPKKNKELRKDSIDLQYAVENHNEGIAPYFRKVIGQEMRRWCKNNGYDLYADGLKVYTTIDSRLQKHAEEAVWQHMDTLQKLFDDHWKGRDPWTKEKEDGSGFTAYKNYLSVVIKRTDAYKSLKKKFPSDKDSVEYYLKLPKKMTVFGYDGAIDTLMSSYDSLKYYKRFLHSGFMSIDPHTGHIKAWVGGVSHRFFKYDHVRQGKRQPGSTFKPIVYATILGETGHVYSPCFDVVDAPVTFVTDDPKKPTWTPSNADGKYTGDTLTLRQAMARSVNSITAYMMKLMGDQTPQKVRDYAYKLGIEGPLEAVPAMCLGVFDVSVYELVGAYGTFVNNGFYVKPQFVLKIEDQHGNVVKEFIPEKRKVLSEKLAYTMLYMLRGATEEKGGTGQGLRKYGLLKHDEENQIGAKTGTTQNYSDGWFVGVTKDLVSGAWVGGEDRAIRFRTLEYGQGSRMALPIWGLYMQKVYADTSLKITKGPFKKPKGLSSDLDFNCNSEKNDSIAKVNNDPLLLDDMSLFDE